MRLDRFPFAAPIVWAFAAWAALIAAPAMAQDARRDVLEISFARFFRQPVGARGLEITDALRAAGGQPVRLVGCATEQGRCAGSALYTKTLRVA